MPEKCAYGCASLAYLFFCCRAGKSTPFDQRRHGAAAGDPYPDLGMGFDGREGHGQIRWGDGHRGEGRSWEMAGGAVAKEGRRPLCHGYQWHQSYLAEEYHGRRGMGLFGGVQYGIADGEGKRKIPGNHSP